MITYSKLPCSTRMTDCALSNLHDVFAMRCNQIIANAVVVGRVVTRDVSMGGKDD